MAWLIMRGDGSERCLICRDRNYDASFYVAWAPTSGPWPSDPGFPVCSFAHAWQLATQLLELRG